MNKTIGLIADATSIGDVLIDVYNVMTIRKQNKENRNFVVGAHIALSVLAVGFSIWQTEAIKKEVRKSKNGGS
jgi:hypothetical protein